MGGYAELKGKALDWAVRLCFGLPLKKMPDKVVATPLKVKDFFGDDFEKQVKSRRAIVKKINDNFLVKKNGQVALFCTGGVGASLFADNAYILCHVPKVDEIVFVGTGGGIGKEVNMADVHVPHTCKRLDKVLEVLIPLDAPAKADQQTIGELLPLMKAGVEDLGIKIHSGIHATVPFVCSETKELLTSLQRQNVLSVDMELSVLYALANYYGKRTAGIIRIGDCPLKGLMFWDSMNSKVKLKEEIHRRILYALLKHLFD
jgi:purine-nucleoside phosphorylase